LISEIEKNHGCNQEDRVKEGCIKEGFVKEGCIKKENR